LPRRRRPYGTQPQGVFEDKWGGFGSDGLGRGVLNLISPEGLDCRGSRTYSGLQTIAVSTAKGTAVVASDLVYLHKGFMMDLPSAVMVDMISWLKGYDTIRAKATSTDLVFGGHDMVQVNDYPRVAEDITRLV